jgi:hypothetical protein
MTQNISQSDVEQMEEVHESVSYFFLTGERRPFELAAAAGIEDERCGGEAPAGCVIRVPRTLAKGVRRWGVSRVARLQFLRSEKSRAVRMVFMLVRMLCWRGAR